jgi:hypothetical protein
MHLTQFLGSLVILVKNHYSPEIDRLDASARTIWPPVPEEADPPRWRMERPDSSPGRNRQESAARA